MTSPVRVVLVDEILDGDLVGCGTRRVLMDLARGLDRDRVDPLVVTPSDGAFTRELRDGGTNVLHHGASPGRPLYRRRGRIILPDPMAFGTLALGLPRQAIELRDLLRRHRADVVYLSTFKVHFIGALAARLAAIPSVCHVQGLLQLRQRVKLLRPVYRTWCEANGCRMIAISNAVAESVGGPVGRRPRVIHNGTDTERFRAGPPDPERFAALGLPLGRGPIVGTISRLCSGKRVHLLPELAARVVRTIPDARFLVCGDLDDTNYVRGIREAIAQAGMSDRIVLAGSRPDIPELLRGMDLLVHFLPDEGFGLALTEAMATHVPIVAFAGGGLLEVVDDGRTGLLVPDAKDVGALADRVVGLLQDDGRRRQMGLLAREAVEQRFSRRRFVTDFEDLFVELGRTGRLRLD